MFPKTFFILDFYNLKLLLYYITRDSDYEYNAHYNAHSCSLNDSKNDIMITVISFI